MATLTERAKKTVTTVRQEGLGGLIAGKTAPQSTTQQAKAAEMETKQTSKGRRGSGF